MKTEDEKTAAYDKLAAEKLKMMDFGTKITEQQKKLDETHKRFQQERAKHVEADK
jgi:hypothetical protein